MKPILVPGPISALEPATIREAVKRLIRAAPATFDDGEVELITDKAVERYLYLESHGLRVCCHPNGDIRGLLLTNAYLNPHIIGRHISLTVHRGFYVNSDYYGDEGALKVIDYGFTEADLGEVFFIVQAADLSGMPGHNPSIPGSICADMNWGKKRNDAFDEFAAEFAITGETEVRAVNALSHGLIYLHDLRRGLYETTLGRVGFVDYIRQPYDVKAGLCSFGRVLGGKPIWGVSDAKALSDYAAVCLAR